MLRSLHLHRRSLSILVEGKDIADVKQGTDVQSSDVREVKINITTTEHFVEQMCSLLEERENSFGRRMSLDLRVRSAGFTWVSERK